MKTDQGAAAIAVTEWPVNATEKRWRMAAKLSDLAKEAVSVFDAKDAEIDHYEKRAALLDDTLRDALWGLMEFETDTPRLSYGDKAWLAEIINKAQEVLDYA